MLLRFAGNRNSVCVFFNTFMFITASHFQLFFPPASFKFHGLPSHIDSISKTSSFLSPPSTPPPPVHALLQNQELELQHREGESCVPVPLGHWGRPFYLTHASQPLRLWHSHCPGVSTFTLLFKTLQYTGLEPIPNLISYSFPSPSTCSGQTWLPLPLGPVLSSFQGFSCLPQSETQHST